ncbi:hypothetical protein BURMUCGD1_5806 [Burkholderia multivorans CGD1]|nr:hypothetical protein BURMUCGD1_5806 [Burkholderia multivorans CGD1]
MSSVISKKMRKNTGIPLRDRARPMGPRRAAPCGGAVEMVG